MDDNKLKQETELLEKRLTTGSYLLEIRNKLGLSLASVGKELGVSANYLSEIERGLKLPSDHLITRIADTYNIPDTDLFQKFGKIPILAREEIGKFANLQRTLVEINQNKNLPDHKKEELYDKLHKMYHNLINEIEDW